MTNRLTLSGEAARLLALLAAGPALVEDAGEKLRMVAQDRTLAVSQGAFAELAARQAIARTGKRIRLTDVGLALSRRLAAQGDPFATQHRDTISVEMQTPAGRDTVMINLSESPLAQLMRRRNGSGEAWLSEAEFRAGERLRADYTRGQLMPRLGANWEAPIASGRRGQVTGDLSDMALAARMRVEKALEAVGPELSGVLIDVCCFLKGLELVERERGWPVRSAKLMLKSALASLARHYEPERRARRAIMSWGGEGYRPTMAGRPGREA